MLACKFQTAFFDVNDQQNYLTCMNAGCGRYFGMVNSFICNQCPQQILVESERYPERVVGKRSPDVVTAIFNTSCSQCINYRKDDHNCRFYPNSKTVDELIEDPKRRCPRNLW